jgi:hypothetical protein
MELEVPSPQEKLEVGRSRRPRMRRNSSHAKNSSRKGPGVNPQDTVHDDLLRDTVSTANLDVATANGRGSREESHTVSAVIGRPAERILHERNDGYVDLTFSRLERLYRYDPQGKLF